MDVTFAISTFVGWLGTILTAAIIIRALLSWFALGGQSSLRLLDDITDPIMRPLRRLIPPFGMIDITPIVAIVLIQFIVQLIQKQIY